MLYVKSLGNGENYKDSEEKESAPVSLGGKSEPVTETITGTFTSSTDALTLTTESGITIKQERGGSSYTAPNKSYNTASTLRIYKGNTLTFSGKTIISIEFTWSGSNKGNMSANVGSYEKGGTIWTGEADTVIFTNETDQNVQARPTKIKITYYK